MIPKLTYDEKEDFITVDYVPENQKIASEDMNSIKLTVNELVDIINGNTFFIAKDDAYVTLGTFEEWVAAGKPKFE